jgi:hypothetical protein
VCAVLDSDSGGMLTAFVLTASSAAGVCSSPVPDAADVSLSSLISCPSIDFSAPTGVFFGQPVRLRVFSDI